MALDTSYASVTITGVAPVYLTGAARLGNLTIQNVSGVVSPKSTCVQVWYNSTALNNFNISLPESYTGYVTTKIANIYTSLVNLYP